MSDGQERVGGGGPTDGGGGAPEQGRPGEPTGDVYDWYRRGAKLLAEGHPGAAVQLLSRAAAAEPQSHSIREALARAQFDAGSYAAALENFRAVAMADPSDDYARFGWGISAARLGDFETSAKHLALAVAMSPGTAHYRAALKQTRATLAARAGAYGPLLPGAPGYPGAEAGTEAGAEAVQLDAPDAPGGGAAAGTGQGTDKAGNGAGDAELTDDEEEHE